MLEWVMVTWAEVLGVVTGVTCVVLAIRRNVWTYPIGLVNNAVFFGLFVAAGLYATAGLQVGFAAFAVHGWVRWTHGVEQDAEYVGSAPSRMAVILPLAGVLMAGALLWVLATWTDSTIALPDAVLTSGSLVAQYMLNRKWIQNWFVWLGVDIGYVGLYVATGLTLTAALYAGFAVMTIIGFRSWQAVSRRAASAATVPEPSDAV